MMEDSDEELPAIEISLSQGGGAGTMPSAEEVAAERAHEERLERELQQLREEELRATSAGAGFVARSESSGSEGEAALAAAVRALKVPADVDTAPIRPSPHALALALLRRLPTDAPLRFYEYALQNDRANSARLATEKILHAIGVLLMRPETWNEDQWTMVSSLLCCCVLVAPSCSARRALHVTLAEGGDVAVERVASMAASAAHDAAGEGAGAGEGGALWAARGLQRLSDAARPGGEGGQLLATLLVRHALHALLSNGQPPPPCPPSLSSLSSLATYSARALSPPLRLCALRLSARARSTTLLSALAAPPDDRRPHRDSHKVAVVTSTLRLLFRTQ